MIFAWANRGGTGKVLGEMQVQTAICPLCQAGLNAKGECVGCLLRVGLGTADVPRGFGDFRITCY